MPSTSRRTVLVSLVGGLSPLLSGCNSTNSNATRETTTQPSTSTQSTGGAPAPWVDPSSESDIVLKNDAEEKITVQIEAGDLSKDISVEYSQNWVSGDIIDNGDSFEMTVSTNTGLKKTVQWSAEKKNNQVAIFTIKDTRITGGVYTKGNE